MVGSGNWLIIGIHHDAAMSRRYEAANITFSRDVGNFLGRARNH
jgi:hypothetical protein